MPILFCITILIALHVSDVCRYLKISLKNLSGIPSECHFGYRSGHTHIVRSDPGSNCLQTLSENATNYLLCTFSLYLKL